jgi:CRISPR-associated endonuclease/helicase Cas3
LLDALVELLRALHCTVIILTATLSRERRQQLLGCELSSDAYPLITALPSQQDLAELPVTITDNQTIAVRLLQEDALAIEEAIARAQQGQQVLWIENTVVEAQQRYLDLAARTCELGLACGLLHSRFSADDRQRIEDHWVDLFGKPGRDQRHRQGRILIGTQVLEQSLDIDADFLISRFAPSDMLLQRMGRLWRHSDTPRSPLAVCEAWLLAPPLDLAIDAPPQAFGNSAFVYSPYVLCRSLEVWQARTAINLPQDIRPLIEQTYAQRCEYGAMATWLHELDNGTHKGSYKRTGRKTLQQLARVALAQAGNTLPESKAQTRYSETDSHEVLLLRALLLSGEQVLLPWRRHELSKLDWRKLSAKLMRQVVAVREWDAPLPLPIDTLNKFGFQHCFYLGSPEHDEAILRVALQDETGNLFGVQGARIHAKYRLDYRDDLGYQVLKC